MPGKRNLARERAQHDAPGIQARVFQMLCELLPAFDRALLGHARILDPLPALGVRRPTGPLLPWRLVLRWRRSEGFPLLSARWRPRSKSPAVTTPYAVTAWLLSRLSSDDHLFRIVCHHPA